jgi:hypothetical protein
MSKELATTRKVTEARCWFEYSPLHQALKRIADKNLTLVVATDHGRFGEDACKVIGDKQTTTNLRYKGRNLNFDRCGRI